MDTVAAWAGFLGAWLLVAGPVYQAMLELQQEEIERDRLAEVARATPAPPALSPWWWLLPPVRLALARRRNEQHQLEMTARMSDEDFRALQSFVNKAFGWLLVGTGGLLIATKETRELVETQEWPSWVLWLVVPALALACVAHAVARGLHDRRAAAERATLRAASTS